MYETLAKLKVLTAFLFFNYLISSIAIAEFEVIEPEPFRLQESYEREFQLNDQSFVDRFSYRFTPESQLNWEKQGGQGFRITSGSVSNDETYTVAQLKKRWFFSDYLFGEIRHRRDEDFDSRFDQTLFGVGIRFLEHYTFSVLGDVQAKKQDIDLHLELSWYENSEGNNLKNLEPEKLHNTSFNAGDRIRLALILSDHFYNGKTEEGSYQEKPQTLFAEWLNFLSSKSFFHFWFNYRLKTRYQSFQNNYLLNDEQLRFGSSSLLYFTNKFALYLKFQYEDSERFEILEQLTSDFNRDHTSLTLEFRYEIKSNNLYFLGTHYLYFDEEKNNFATMDAINFHDRNDFIVYTGFRYSITDKLRFKPTLFLNKVSLKKLNKESQVANTNELTGRITFPFEYLFENYNASLSVVPTIEWPGSPFGGLNIQVQFMF